MSYCEDFPCCGHTPADPCERQWYDAPDAFDTRVNPHALCEHESGICDVDLYDEDDDEDGFEDGFGNYVPSYDGMEDAWLDGSYEE